MMTKLKKGDLVHLQRPGYNPDDVLPQIPANLPPAAQASLREFYGWGESNAIYLGLLTPEEAGCGTEHNDERYYGFHLQDHNKLFRAEHRTDLDAALDKVNPTGSWKDLLFALGGTEITLLNKE